MEKQIGFMPALASRLRLLMTLLVAASVVVTDAFPPAPHHSLYGTVRDEMGNPLSVDGAWVIFESESARKLSAIVERDADNGVNYRLSVPIDAGVTFDDYRTTASREAASFQLRVQIGQTIYLPIEMSGDFGRVGQAAGSQRIDLTLGEDRDGDGLPDAWERALLAAAGGGLASIDPHDDVDQDGLSNLEEYQAGTFAYDASDGFSLKIVEVRGENVSLEFMAIRGRTYSIHESSDFKDWNPVRFAVDGAESEESGRQFFQAPNSSVTRVTLDPPAPGVEKRFFKLRVQ